MERAAKELNSAANRMAGDLTTMIADGEELLKAAASASGEGLKAAKTRIGEQVKNAGNALVEASRPLVVKTRETAGAANDYAHANPWTVAGVALAVGALVAFLVAKR